MGGGLDVHLSFEDDFWILPYNALQYCGSCNTESSGFFITPQTASSTSFTITGEDLIVPSTNQNPDQIWTWGEDITLKFHQGSALVVNDTLVAEKMTLTSLSSNWKGVEFKNNSKSTFTDVDILNVGSGAHTGTMTIRDGADVTLVGDNIILGPNFLAEAGSSFLATHDLGASSKDKGPNPELDEGVYFQESVFNEIEDVQKSISVETYPNPFNPLTSFRYQIQNDASVSLKIYNLLGQEIKTLVSEFQSAGNWEYSWDGTDAFGKLVPSGTYLYRLKADDQSITGQLVFVK